MITVYTIYADKCPIYQSTDYHYLKDVWDDIINTPFLANGADYQFKKGEELMFEFIRGDK